MVTRVVHEAERELVEFLLSQPAVAEIAEFRLSEEVTDRFYELIDISRERALSNNEREELDAFMYLEHFAQLLKIEATGRLEQQGAQNNGQ